MYSLMGLPEPAISNRIKKPKKVPKLVIDRTGETDQARYSGLKVTQILDDDEMGKKLAEFQEKKKKGENSKQKLIEEEYVMPFAGEKISSVILSLHLHNHKYLHKFLLISCFDCIVLIIFTITV